MDREELQREEAEATHELIDGEVNKVDLVDRPATGDLWLAVRSADEAQKIIEQGDWTMAGNSAAKREQRSVLTRDEVAATQEEKPMTVAVSDDLETVDRDAKPGDQPKAETVDRIGAALTSEAQPESLTRETVTEVIRDIVPGLMVDALRTLGIIPSQEAPETASSESTERAGAKMSSGRLQRFQGAITKLQEGLTELGDVHRELSGEKVDRQEGEPASAGPVRAQPAVDLVEQMRSLFDQHATKIEAKIDEKLSLVSEDVKRVNDRVDKVKSALGKPSTDPNDETKEVKRGKKGGVFSGLIFNQQ